MRALRISLGYAGLAALWMGAVFWASSQAGWPHVPHSLLAHDKALHAIAYAVLAALVSRALAPARLGAARTALLAAAIAAAYGASDEWHQSFVPGRSADALDLVADAIGAAAGAAIAAALSWRRAGRHLAGQGGAG